jgi:hypothetical protein
MAAGPAQAGQQVRMWSGGIDIGADEDWSAVGKA